MLDWVQFYSHRRLYDAVLRDRHRSHDSHRAFALATGELAYTWRPDSIDDGDKAGHIDDPTNKSMTTLRPKVICATPQSSVTPDLDLGSRSSDRTTLIR